MSDDARLMDIVRNAKSELESQSDSDSGWDEAETVPRWRPTVVAVAVAIASVALVAVIVGLALKRAAEDNNCYAFNECYLAEGRRRDDSPYACRLTVYPQPQAPHCNSHYYCVDGACSGAPYGQGLEMVGRQNVEQWEKDGLLLERVREFLSSHLMAHLGNLSTTSRVTTEYARSAAEAQLEASSWEEAFQQLSRLRGLRPEDVLAFRETWTDEDTRILRNLSPDADGFAQGSLSTYSFRQRLPSLSSLKESFALHDIAIVGSGSNLEGRNLGAEIDGHQEVARFNNLVGSRVNVSDLGAKLTVHIMNYQVQALSSPGVKEFDLEYGHPWKSYCKRLFSISTFNEASENLFVLRPSVMCSLGFAIGEFTRGFLFFWFVGRFFRSADIYGMKGIDHYNISFNAFEGPIIEKYLRFEHLLYGIAAEMRWIRYV